MGAARRIIVGRFMNCGQTCVAGDHVYVHNSIKTEFLRSLKDILIEFYGTNIS
jgi:aldehyde dehydrogenase (NAD+)